MRFKTPRHVIRQGYHAFDWLDSDLFLPTLWEHFPELVLGNYLVNTSFDSGSLIISPRQREQGWHTIGKSAHSPRIERLDQIPHDQFDEWLVFDQPIQVLNFETFVNFYGFSPLDEDPEGFPFWNQVSRWNPLHVIGENDNLYLVTRSESIAKRILNLPE